MGVREQFAGVLGSVQNIVLGLLVIAIVVVIFYAVVNLLITTGLIDNGSTFYTDYITNINKLSSLVGTSIDITKLIIVIGLFMLVLAYLMWRAE